MRIVSKTGGKPPTTTRRAVPVKKPVTKTTTVRRKFNGEMDLSLPLKPQKATGSLHTAKIFLHGERGIGKTELSSLFPDTLHCFFEPGGEFLDGLYRLPIHGQFTEWEQFVTVLDNLIGEKALNKKGSNKFQMVVVDTADFAWDLCCSYICKKFNEDDINTGTLAYDRGNKKVRKEFHEQILRVTGSGRGMMFISHTKSESMQKATGLTSDKLVATVEKKGREFLSGFCDLELCYAYVRDERYLIVRGSDAVQAKCRIKGRFFTPDGDQIHAIPMGESAEEAYANFEAAYGNKQDEEHRLLRRPELSEKKAAWKANK